MSEEIEQAYKDAFWDIQMNTPGRDLGRVAFEEGWLRSMQTKDKPLNVEMIQQALSEVCSAKLCEINSMSSRTEMLRKMDSAIEILKALLSENDTSDFSSQEVVPLKDYQKLSALCSRQGIENMQLLDEIEELNSRLSAHEKRLNEQAKLSVLIQQEETMRNQK